MRYFAWRKGKEKAEIGDSSTPLKYILLHLLLTVTLPPNCLLHFRRLVLG